MRKYWCRICGYVYDPQEGDPGNGVAPGTAFEDLPDLWVCPKCGAPRKYFEPLPQAPTPAGRRGPETARLRIGG